MNSCKAAVVAERRKLASASSDKCIIRPNFHYIYVTICLNTAAHNTRQKVSACLYYVYSSFKLWNLYTNQKVEHLDNNTISFMTSINNTSTW